MTRALLISSALIAGGCTTPNVRDTSAIDAQTARCEDVDCVIGLMDTLPQGHDSERYPFVEGYPDTNLAELKAQGKLEVGIMNPLLIPLGFYGYGWVTPKHFGGIDSCQVRYLPGLNWLSLKHELAHCQGYADHGIPLVAADYTEDQHYVLKRDGVSKWTDTRYYQIEQDRERRN